MLQHTSPLLALLSPHGEWGYWVFPQRINNHMKSELLIGLCVLERQKKDRERERRNMTSGRWQRNVVKFHTWWTDTLLLLHLCWRNRGNGRCIQRLFGKDIDVYKVIIGKDILINKQHGIAWRCWFSYSYCMYSRRATTRCWEYHHKELLLVLIFFVLWDVHKQKLGITQTPVMFCNRYAWKS